MNQSKAEDAAEKCKPVFAKMFNTGCFFFYYSVKKYYKCLFPLPIFLIPKYDQM